MTGFILGGSKITGDGDCSHEIKGHLLFERKAMTNLDSILKSTVQVRCAILDAWGWSTGTTQRDGVGREEGGGFRMGNTCIPVVDSF